MITLDDVRPRPEAPASAGTHARPLRITLLHAMLYVCIASSFFTFVQPAPYEGLVALLGLVCLMAGVTVDRKIFPLVFLLFVLEAAGLVSLFQVVGEPETGDFMFISVYLAITGVVFAVIFSDDCAARLEILRSAYVLAAVIAALLGMAGYFRAFPGSDIFLMNNRAVSSFKDPNIFGPFLILPLLFMIERFLAGVFKLRYVLAALIIAAGLLLALSRAAWGHFTLSVVTMTFLLLVTRPDRASRRRIVWTTFAMLGAIAVLVAGMFSIEEVREMLVQRFTLLQEYDTGSSGARFVIQSKSIEEALRHPNGMGPWVFARLYGLVSHNSYLGTFVNHGWAGGIAYLTMTLLTLWLGLRTALIRTPWQSMQIAVFGTYVGMCFESAVVDTDHWRHYYLLLGLVWGLGAASLNHARREAPAPYATARWQAA